MNRSALIIVSVLFFGIMSAAQAVVVADTNITLASNDNRADYAITINQDATYRDPTTLWFNKKNNYLTSTLTPVTWNIDQEADYYLVSDGDAFTPENIASGKFQPLFTLDHPYSLDVPVFGDFYLGVATTATFSTAPRPTYASRDVWGWTRISNGLNGLRMVNNAVAYNEGGIIVGTINAIAVPEPSTLSLVSLGLVAGFFLRQRRQRARPAP